MIGNLLFTGAIGPGYNCLRQAGIERMRSSCTTEKVRVINGGGQPGERTGDGAFIPASE